MASKLNKACREVPGTLAEAWRNVAAEMESRSEVHRQFSTTMTEEIVKPLKQLLDNQHKTRKSVNATQNNLFVVFFLLFTLRFFNLYTHNTSIEIGQLLCGFFFLSF